MEGYRHATVVFFTDGKFLKVRATLFIKMGKEAEAIANAEKTVASMMEKLNEDNAELHLRLMTQDEIDAWIVEQDPVDVTKVYPTDPVLLPDIN